MAFDGRAYRIGNWSSDSNYQELPDISSSNPHESNTSSVLTSSNLSRCSGSRKNDSQQYHL